MVLATGFTLFACTQEPAFDSEMADSSAYPIRITGAIEQVHTKANAAGFVDKDAIGLYAVNYTDNNTLPGTLAVSGNQADNVRYIFDETNQKWNPVKAVYYKDVNTHVDLYLTYPYQTSITDVDSYGFAVQKDQSTEATVSALSGYEASDFLWGKAENISPAEATVPVTLKHKLSAVQVTLVEKDGFAEDEFGALSKSILVTNTTRKATINLAQGTVTAVGGPQLDGIVMCPQENGSFRAIVIPQTISAGTRLFSITLGGVVYGFSQTDDVLYQAEKQMNVEIKISKKTPSGEYELELGAIQIVDWTEDRNTHGGEARQYYVVTLETPGTLGRVIKNAGKNPDKIRNLKICGPVTDSDFYFMRDSMKILEAINMKETVLKDIPADYTHIYGVPTPTRIEDNMIPVSAFFGKSSLIYFAFPEGTTEILDNAFYNTRLSGALIIPDNVTIIRYGAFTNTLISSVSLPAQLKTIGAYAFANCRFISNHVVFPETLLSIEAGAFAGCNLSGELVLPSHLEVIGNSAFGGNNFCGDLYIPDTVKEIGASAFQQAGNFQGHLSIGSVDNLQELTFAGCSFAGQLILSEGIIRVPRFCFSGNSFYSIVLPSSLRSIEDGAFSNNPMLSEGIVIPEGVVSIGEYAFAGCSACPSIVLPSTLQTIMTYAFQNDYGISRIICNAIEPPNVFSGAFDGVSKSSFTLQVPAQSVKRYQSDSGWSDFISIGAHSDFSVNRSKIRTLNAGGDFSLRLNAPSLQSWTVSELPDWITVSPDKGVGKTEITITIHEMDRTNEKFNVEERNDLFTYYTTHLGRAGEVVFELPEKEYSCSIDVEQYDSDHVDGEVHLFQSATQGAGIDIVFLGDGYDAKDIKDERFFSVAQEGYQHFFDIEPYRTYKDYFNVYAITCLSGDSGLNTVNGFKENAFGGEVVNMTKLLEWAKKVHAGFDYANSLIILLQNASSPNGYTNILMDIGASISVCPVSNVSYPWDFRGVIQHEAGGHGFGHLADESIWHDEFYQNCPCPCCLHDDLTPYQALGFYRNVSQPASINSVPWAHLIFHPDYSDYVDMFEGAFMHARGIYRSEAQSCMINNVPYFPAICRQIIVERIMEMAGEEFSLEQFYEKDSNADLARLNQLSTTNQAPIKPRHESIYIYRDNNDNQ